MVTTGVRIPMLFRLWSGGKAMTSTQKQRIEFLRGKGESYGTIALELGMPENTVKSFCRRNRIGRARQSEQPVASVACDNCEIPLQHMPGAKQKRFCCDTCRMTWWKAHREAVHRKAVYRFVCPICGTEFESYGNKHRKYCSRACYGASRRALS